jgi:TonB family protein
MSPQLPQQPAPGADTGVFDILVDEFGDVETVRLTSPAHRYYDRMLVAAAKAWKFKPATLNGQPVKYRVRIPIILADPR